MIVSNHHKMQVLRLMIVSEYHHCPHFISHDLQTYDSVKTKSPGFAYRRIVIRKLAQNMIQHLRSLLIRRPNCVRVDVRGGRSLRMTRPVAHRLQRNPCREEQRNIRVPQRMNRNLRQIGARNEIVEPTRYAVRVDRCTVVLRKNPVTVNPAITHRNAFLALPFAMLL